MLYTPSTSLASPLSSSGIYTLAPGIVSPVWASVIVPVIDPCAQMVTGNKEANNRYRILFVIELLYTIIFCYGCGAQLDMRSTTIYNICNNIIEIYHKSKL